MKKNIFIGLILLFSFSLAGCSLFSSLGKESLPDSFKIGDTIVIPNNYEIKMKSVEFAPKVMPDDPATFYSSFEVDDQNDTYFHTVFEVKNLGASQKTPAEIMTVTLLEDDKTGYLCSGWVERNGDFDLAGEAFVIPLSTDVIHYLTEVPVRLANGAKPPTVQITVNGHTMTYPGDGSVGSDLITLDLGDEPEENANWQDGEEISLEQPIAEEGFGKLTVAKTSFTSSVEPTNKGSLYAVNDAKEQNRVYWDAEISFENLAADSVEATEVLDAVAIFDNKYEYSSFILVEQEGNSADLLDGVMVTINPGTTEKMHYIFELPKELENSSRPLALVITCNSKDYYYKFR